MCASPTRGLTGAIALFALHATACEPSPLGEIDSGRPARDAALEAAIDAALDPAPDAGTPSADASRTDGDAGDEDGGGSADAGPDSGAGTCAPPFRPMLAHDLRGATVGDGYLSWIRSVVDDAHSVSFGRAVRIRTNPGDMLLPACSGGHTFAGRSDLPSPVPPGRTIWFRVYQYIPSSFSFGYKYSTIDRDAAAACRQSPDGNAWLKWLVLAPDIGTARIYLSPTATRRAVAPTERRVRIISEALHRPGDFTAELPRDRWFALQIAVRVSDGDDGFIRAWIDDEYLGEVQGRTAVSGASLVEWGIGDYWNGVPWTDGAEGRTDFWIDEIVVASDADGYDAPTGRDSGGRAYIPSCIRVSDLTD